jgi:hypothetical protein
MSSELVRDRLVLGLRFVVGGSSLLWGLYLIFYVAQRSPSGIFNTILGLVVLFVTWGFLLPYAMPADRVEWNPGADASSGAPRPPSPQSSGPVASGRNDPRPAPRPTATTPPAARPAPSPLPRSIARAAAPIPPARVVPAPRPAPRPLAASAPPAMTLSEEDREIESILAELPGPLDPTLATASPDEVIRRLDALIDDLSSGSA